MNPEIVAWQYRYEMWSGGWSAWSQPIFEKPVNPDWQIRPVYAGPVMRIENYPESEERLEDWQIAFSMAAQAMHNHGMPISCPWEGDLDDEEMERYNGLVAAIDSYLTVFPPSKAHPNQIPNINERGRE